MRRVLISFIGTGSLENEGSSRKYREAEYSYQGRTIKSSFIASALGEFLDIDTYYLFGTMKSIWEAVYLHYAKKNIDDNYAYQLYEQAENANHDTSLNEVHLEGIEGLLKNHSKVIPIYYGINEKQIEDNFEIFSNTLSNLQDGDTIYLDITHSFRSLPLFATTAISFIQDVTDKKINFGGIYYGMLEASKEFNNRTPIVDLSYISELQRWIKGAYGFSNFGQGELISGLLSEKNKTLSKKLQEFTNMLSLNYIHELKSQINVLTHLSNNEQDFSYPEKLVIPKVFSNFARHFDNCKRQSEYQLELSKWHFEKASYALSYICLIESIITYVCEIERFNYKDKNKRERAKTLIINDNKYQDIKDVYSPANEARKSSAHLIEDFSIKSKRTIEDLKKYIKKFDLILKTRC